MFDVVSFGSAVVDIFADTGADEKEGYMVYPVERKLLLKDLRFDIGGGGTNTAVAFSRFGLKTGYLGKLGDDFGGEKVLSLLKKEKIKFLGKIQKNAITGYSIILDSKEKNRTVLTYKGINNEVAYSNEIKKIKTKWIYFSSLLGKSFETQKKLAKKLHHQGVRIAFNPSDYLIQKKNLREILTFCDVLILNKEESIMLTKKKKIDEILFRLRKLGPKIVVVTDKDKKTFAYDGKEKNYIIPHKIKVVERTGAGDAFASGFVAGQIVGRSIKESLKLGLEESESVIRYIGAKNNLIKRNLKKLK